MEHIPQYERLGPEFKRLYEGGASVNTIAAAHGMPWKQAKEILHFALTGERPKWKNHARTGTRKRDVPKYVQIAPRYNRKLWMRA